MSYPSLLVTLVLFTIYVCSSSSTVAHTSAVVPTHQPTTAVSKKYRCFRPFESLDTFSAVGLNPKDNCRFDYMTIITANASITCYGPKKSVNDTAQEEITPSELGHTSNSNNNENEKQGCYATVNFVASPPHDGYSPGKGPIIGDEARYTLRLHSIGNSAIHYKGEGRVTDKGDVYKDAEEERWHGYSVCCALLDQPEYGECSWVDTDTSPLSEMEDRPNKKLLMRFCALHKRDASEGSQDEPDPKDPLGLLKREKEIQEKIIASNRRKELNNEGDAKGEVPMETFSGSVTKPLHKAVVGKWMIELRLFRGDQAVGRLSILLTLTEAMLNAAGLHPHGTDESTSSNNDTETLHSTNSLSSITVTKDMVLVKNSTDDEL